VDDEIRKRFQTEYLAWKQDPEAIAIASRRATSLKTWDQMPHQLADDLARRHITTIEDLAHLPDSAIGAIPFGRQWRDKAMAYLAAANEDARFTELRDENAALRASIDQMSAEIEKTQKLMRSLMGEIGPAGGVKTPQ
jgi:peptidoglycan hydrolase CwlO-like protein